MNSQRALKGTLASLTIIVLLGGNAAFADKPQTQTQTLIFQAAGGPAPLPPAGVTDAGTQHYDFKGGSLVSAQIGSVSFGPGSSLSYRMSVDVKGQTAKGTADFQITGTTTDNHEVSARGEVSIGGMVPEEIPLGCTSMCSSAIPVFFRGLVNATVSSASTNSHITSTMLIESPYFNPFGNPISMVSTETPTPAIVIVAGYDSATIDWKGTSVNGAMAGLLGASTAVAGTLTLTSSEHEDLVTGTASDNGNMNFSNMSPTSLNATGNYEGQSVIPMPGSPGCSAEVAAFGGAPCTFDCTSMLAAQGLPAIPRTCTGTSFASSGQFSLNSGSSHKDNDKGKTKNGQVSIGGAYSVIWSAPALAVIASGTAVVTQRSN